MDEYFRQQNIKLRSLKNYELPKMIHEILLVEIDLIPKTEDKKDFLRESIEEIKKITNAECESTLSYFEKLIKT